MSRLLAMRVGAHLTPLMKRSVLVKPAIPKWCWWCLTQKIGLGHLLQTFWQAHDPTQGYRQGNDRGTQYRSAIFASDKGQLDQIMQSAHSYQKALTAAGYGKITTEIALADEFYYAETYHQQYLHKVPHGYCGLQGTGVACPDKSSTSGLAVITHK